MTACAQRLQLGIGVAALCAAGFTAALRGAPAAPMPAPVPEAAPGDRPTPIPAGTAVEPPPRTTPAPEIVPLYVGEPVPALGGLEWRGSARIDTFEPGVVYVLVFSPTEAELNAIAGEFNRLVAAHPKGALVVAGVMMCARDEAPHAAQPAHAPAGLERDAETPVFALADDPSGRTRADWVAATGFQVPPVALIVDGQGRLAWCGPALGAVVFAPRVLDGTYDLAAAIEADRADTRVRARREAMLVARYAPEIERIEKAYLGRDGDKLVRTIEELVQLDEKAFIRYRLHQYTALMERLGDRQRAREVGLKLVASPHADWEVLSNLAWAIVGSDTVIPQSWRDTDLAFAAAEEAVRRSDRPRAEALDTLARACFVRGDVTSAIEHQRRAVEACEDARLVEEYQAVLREYENAGKRR